jgi:hypothetical protein
VIDLLIVCVASTLASVLVVAALGDLAELVEYAASSRHPIPGRVSLPQPFVTVHMPISNEPPEVVIPALHALAALDYPRYEVVVVDNNTRDPGLWRPIERVCGALPERLRFVHVEEWPGFKAGALNLALRHSSPHAAIVVVVDADYVVEPRFLDEIVSLFVDDAVAFVQAPQDYEYPTGSWLRDIFYWEYWQFFAVGMRLRERQNAILMHGTMVAIRRRAIDDIGGWGEWCLTEDSELGLRLHAHGGRGVYRFQSLGRGAVPLLFRDFTRQRHRWVTGGVQALKRHWRLLLRPSGLRRGQRARYLQGWLPWFRDAMFAVVSIALVAAATAATAGVAPGAAPAVLAAAIVVAAMAIVVRQIVVCRSILRCSWRHSIGVTLATLALVWTIARAWLGGWHERDRVFTRTPKSPEARRAPVTIRLELAVAAAAAALAIAADDGFAGTLTSCGSAVAASVAAIAAAGPVVDARMPRAAAPGDARVRARRFSTGSWRERYIRRVRTVRPPTSSRS